MNWLAHVFLSEQNIDFQMGNYLADPLKGKSWDDATKHFNNGLETHKKIDSFTDSHPIISTSKARLREKGLLKSIVIDITYDYFLTKNWDTFCTIPIEIFTKNFYTQANKRLEILPLNAKTSINRLIEYKLLNAYEKIDDLKNSFNKFDRRLSEKLASRDTVSSYFQAVVKNIALLEKDFLIFFPLLCEEIRKNLNSEKISHWKVL